jgi:internalin A
MNMDATWRRLTAWYATHIPGLIEDLNAPATQAAIDRTEHELGMSLPDDFKRFYLRVDGQKGQTYGMIFGLQLVSLERLLFHWKTFRDVYNDDPRIGMDSQRSSIPPNAIRLQYINLKWIPFAEDGGGGFLGLDFDPGPAGRAGQVINLGRYANKKVVIANSFADFLERVADELEKGKGRVYASAGLKIFDHADLGDVDFADGLAKCVRR